MAKKAKKTTKRSALSKVARSVPIKGKAGARNRSSAPKSKPATPMKPKPIARVKPATKSPAVDANVGDAAILKATGKSWREWLEVLDAAKCRTMDHVAISKVMQDQYKIGDWWSQMVTAGYEQARGLRQKHETPDGFQASMSKTIGAPLARIFRAWNDASDRVRWLGEAPIEILTATPDKSMRLTWNAKGPEFGTGVEVYFWFREANRTMVQVQQRTLTSTEAVNRVKALWSVKLESLRSFLEKGN